MDIDSGKFAHTALVRLCGLDRLTVVVTDAPPSPAVSDKLRKCGVRLVIADDAMHG